MMAIPDASGSTNRAFVLGGSNPVSTWTLSWVMKLMMHSMFRSPESLLLRLEADQHADLVSETLFQALSQKRGSGQTSLKSALWTSFGTEYIFLGIWKLLWALCTWTGAYYILREIMIFANDSTKLEILALQILITSVVASVAIQRLYAGAFATRTKIRSALVAVVYKKSLMLSPSNVQIGSIVNLVSTDIEAVADCASHWHFLWSGCIEVVAILTLAYVLAGNAALLAIVFVLLTLPIQLYLGYLVSGASAEWIKSSGQRLHLMTEILTAVKLIKFYTWEKHFEGRVSELRHREATSSARQIWLRALNFAIVMATPVIATLACLSQASGLSAIESFTLLSLFNTLRYPLMLMPLAVKSLASALNGLASLDRFLALSELKDDRVLTSDRQNPLMIEMKDADLQWDGTDLPTLSKLNINLKRGEILAVVGDVGTGKSSLLAGILGQAGLSSGSITINGALSYCPQEAWLINQSLRDNILFGSEYDSVRYEHVIAVCQLERDLTILPEGDQTQICERGANLSGGQRQRVSVARAVYNMSDIVLLDDPLSALDQHVGRSLFEQCIAGFIKNRAVVLVTHQLQYLPLCHQIAVMGNNQIQECGTFKDLMSIPNGLLRTLMSEHTDIDVDAEDEIAEEIHLPSDNDDSPDRRPANHQRRRSSLSKIVSMDLPSDDDEDTAMIIKPSNQRFSESDATSCIELTEKTSANDVLKLLADNEKTVRRVSLLNSSHTINASVLARKAELNHNGPSPYFHHTVGGRAEFQTTLQRNELAHLTSHFIKCEIPSQVEAKFIPSSALLKYLRQGSGLTASIILIVYFMLVHGIRIASDVWIKVWKGGDTGVMAGYSLQHLNPYVYAGLGFLFALGVFTRGHLLARSTASKARYLHDSMLQALLSAPMEFYDKTPLGTILQSSSKHQADADDRLPDTGLQFLTYIPLAVGAVAVVIAQSNNPSAISFAMVLLTVVGACLVALPSKSGAAKHFAEREASAKPALFSHLAASLEGLFSIRAFAAQERFTSVLLSQLDDVAVYQTATQSLKFFVALYVDILCSLAIYATAFLFALDARSDAATIGLALSSAMQLLVFVQWTLRMVEEISSSMESVAGLQSFCDDVPREALPEIEGERPDSDWPQSGLISFRDIILRYTRYGVAVLKQVSFVVKPREKIGIVGRTGSGKSTLLIALLRIVESSGGRIIIDGVDIARIGLRDLRKRIAIIPQEPVVFAGTVRSNLDAYNEFSDDAIWHALTAVQLDVNIRAMKGGLDAVVVENGSNFSLGQRQLFCIARAILCKSKVVVLDEATAAIDSKTDAIVQKAIADNFSDCTILTIAHRLNTIIESDKILFMDQGRVAEFDKPLTLLANPKGHFYSLVEQTGPDSARKLREMAQAKHDRSVEVLHADDEPHSGAFLDALARPVDPVD